MENCKQSKPIYGLLIKIIMIGLVILAIYFLYIHRMHLAAYSGSLFLLFFLACPLMHLFMHGGHHHGGSHKKHDESK